jgi:GDP-L-fucose synthase
MKNGEDKNMYSKIFITGATGFVGKNLCCHLKHHYGKDLNITAGSSKWCDLKVKEQVDHFFNITRPDCVIHLAATCGGIGANKERPGKFMNDNLMMGLNVINAAKKYGVKKFVFAGTICAYPKYCPIPFQESEMWNGYPEETNAPYGIAKKTLTELLLAYKDEYDFDSVNLYPTNMYGPWDNFGPTGHVIPHIIVKMYKAIIKGEDCIELWGDGSPTRDFLYVEDFCRAVNASLRHSKMTSQPINIGTEQEWSIKETAEMIADKMGYNGDIVWDVTRDNGQPRRKVDYTAAQAILGYEPHTDLNEGLTKTIRWFTNNINRIEK